MDYSDRDIIVAPATPPHIRAPLAVIRISGADCWTFLDRWFQPFRKGPWRAWNARYGSWHDDNGLVDHVVVLTYAAPASYTGQDMLEILCHGNPLFVNAIAETCRRSGARLARPGEFTQRAFLNGKKDLTEAEAVHELIEAKTRYQAELIRAQSGKGLATVVRAEMDEILLIQAHIEAGIDYAEDDIDPMESRELLDRVARLQKRLARLHESAAFAKGMRRGFRVLLTGPPNVGKSTLFNALLAQERAIVSDTPGTTRDFISEEVALRGLPVVLIDTAGVNQTIDPIEKMGIQKIFELLGTVDLVLYLTPLGNEIPPYRELTQLASEKWITVYTKSDQTTRVDPGKLAVSASEHVGINRLKEEIVLRLSAAFKGQTAMLINRRQEDALAEGVKLLQTALDDHRKGFGDEILSTHLNHVRRKLGEITGETTVDDILDRMFSTFCLGK